MLRKEEKIERDIKLLEMYEKYTSVMLNPNLSLDEKINLKNKLFIKIVGE
ncbi:hypothetical protein [Borrelia miyamotoi]|nr:hypothetical protein [Borrelia miyamotoi]